MRADLPNLEALSFPQAKLVNAICVDFEEDWRGAAQPAIQEYVDRVGEDDEPSVRLVLLRELLTVERELREDDARAHDLDTYRALGTVKQ